MSDASGFGKFVPGFEFLQNLAGQAAGGVAQGLEKSIPQLPNLGNWVAPTFNVEDLEKRIDELKAVHFWLDQNAKALGATIQALEVQKMTLATLKTMNFSLGDVANALKIKAADTMANFTGTPPAPAPGPTQFAGLEVPARTYGMPAPPPEPDDEEEDDEEVEAEAPHPPAARQPAKRPPVRKEAAASTPAGGTIDPVQWWGALSQQFQTIAANAMKDVAKQTTLDTTRKVASGLTEQAVKTTTGMAGKATRAVTSRVARNVGAAAGMGKAAVRAVSGGRKPPTSKAPAPAQARKPAVTQPMAAGDWPLPTAFFPGFQPAPAPSPSAKPPARKPATKAVAKKVTAKPTAKKTAAKKAPGKKAAGTSRRR
ncbi:hypothetical protein J2W49_004823 [Hydrogenophaga palleronii]|uniref:Transcriptional regulator n=1 Tax=Hydrogenophaga palleronii TaxID=65655 RepID=A0ABU1WU61_9BURK|nr:PhaM family polyhydroxyalkanoate granule multifunctional regulatory protein [Hydrogenophaga palleronii]MDR7152845.1 hypothetical protein [Hydrogenophaga palleronii]